jgi:hypothetical protein
VTCSRMDEDILMICLWNMKKGKKIHQIRVLLPSSPLQSANARLSADGNFLFVWSQNYISAFYWKIVNKRFRLLWKNGRQLERIDLTLENALRLNGRNKKYLQSLKKFAVYRSKTTKDKLQIKSTFFRVIF